MSADLGSDFYCDGDITPDLRMVEGRENLALALVRRLWGPLWYDPNYGFPLIELINSVGESAWEIETAVRQEFLKDERVESVDCKCEFDGEITRIHCVVTDSEGSFSFIAAASQIGIEMYDFLEAA